MGTSANHAIPLAIRCNAPVWAYPAFCTSEAVDARTRCLQGQCDKLPGGWGQGLQEAALPGESGARYATRSACSGSRTFT